MTTPSIASSSSLSLLAWLAIAAVIVSLLGALFFHGVAAALWRISLARGQYSQAHVKLACWVLGVPLLGMTCHAVQSGSIASAVTAWVFAEISLLTVCLGGSACTEECLAFGVSVSLLLSTMLRLFLAEDVVAILKEPSDA